MKEEMKWRVVAVFLYKELIVMTVVELIVIIFAAA